MICCTCGVTDANIDLRPGLVFFTFPVQIGRSTVEERQVCGGCELAHRARVAARKSTQAAAKAQPTHVVGQPSSSPRARVANSWPAEAPSVSGDLFADGADE